jgi:hypothetical protein
VSAEISLPTLDYINIYMSEGVSVLQIYKDYIDNLASFFSRNGVIAKRLLLTKDEINYCSSYEIGSKDIGSLLESLDPEQKRIVGQKFLGERCGGIHDTLHSLDELIDIKGLRFIFNDEPMPIGLYNEGLKGDYISQYLGYDWYNNENLSKLEGNSLLVLRTYIDFIENLAICTTNCALAKQILSEDDIKYSSSYESRSEDVESLLKFLNPEQKRIFGHLLQKEKHGGIYDTLLSLDELIDKGLKLILNDVPLPTGLTGEGMAGDYVKRYLGHDWLSDIS